MSHPQGQVSISPLAYLSVYLPVGLFVCLSARWPICLSLHKIMSVVSVRIRIYAYQSVCLRVCECVFLCVYVYVFSSACVLVCVSKTSFLGQIFGIIPLLRLCQQRYIIVY